MKTQSTFSKIKKLFTDGLLPGVDMVSRKTDGSVILRKGYYYRHGMDASQFSASVMRLLGQNSVDASFVKSGDQWRPFSGGSTTADSSHFFVIVK